MTGDVHLRVQMRNKPYLLPEIMNNTLFDSQGLYAMDSVNNE